MTKVRIEDIVFWLIMAAIVAIALWMLHGSPQESSAIISVGLFVVASEILVWKAFFRIDKKTAVGFIKLKNDINALSLRINGIETKVINTNEQLSHNHQELKTLITKKR